MWPFSKRKKQYEDITIYNDDGTFIHKSAKRQKASDDLKKIRANIRECKANNDIKRQEKYLRLFFHFIIEHDFKHARNDLERYPKFLDKIGKHKEAAKARELGAVEQRKSWIRFKTVRSEQLSNFDYIMLRVNGPCFEECITREDKIVKNSKSIRNKWVLCDYKPRCGCSMFGETKKGAERKGLTIPE